MTGTDFSKLLQEIDAFPDTVYLYHTVGTAAIPMHQHKKDQMIYIEGSVAYLHTPEKSFLLPARHFVWIPAETRHAIEFKTHTHTSIHKSFYFPTCMPSMGTGLSSTGIYPVKSLIMEMILFIETWNGNIEETDVFRFQFLETLRNVVLKTSGRPFILELPTTTNERVTAILQYINEHIDEPLYLEEVGKKFGFSSRSISRLFRNVLKISFSKYVTLTRVIKSLKLLLETDLSISEVAFKMGYTSLAAYSNVFFQLMNTRPAEFRRSFR